MSDSQTSPAPLPQPIWDSSALAEARQTALFRVRWFGQDSPGVRAADRWSAQGLSEQVAPTFPPRWIGSLASSWTRPDSTSCVRSTARRTEPSTGHCVAGPPAWPPGASACPGEGGQVEWLPDDDFSPALTDGPPPGRAGWRSNRSAHAGRSRPCASLPGSLAGAGAALFQR